MSDPAGNRPAPQILISGSLAFDYIMTFPGSFRDYILPDKVHALSISFLFDSLVRFRGGVAGNVAYNLALLGEKPSIVGAGGTDFDEYRAAFCDLGVDMGLVVDDRETLTGSSFMSTDLSGNQIAGFFPGASRVAAEISVAEAARGAALGIVGATTLEAMDRHAREFAAAGCRLVYDPSQQVVAAPAADLETGIGLAWAVIGSDYEFGVIEHKTGLSIDAIADRTEVVAVTYGEQGSEIRCRGERVSIPSVPAAPLADPTGAGDAYRAGLLKGLLLGLPLEVAGRMGALAGTYAIEQRGTQEHRYTPADFVARFDRSFGDYAQTVDVEWLEHPVPVGTGADRLDHGIEREARG